MDLTAGSLVQALIAVILAAALLLAGIRWIRGSRRHNPGQIQPPIVRRDSELDDRVRALFAAAAAAGDRPSEDDIAQARLGGPRGAPQLGAAPMVRQQAENTPWPIDSGHVT